MINSQMNYTKITDGINEHDEIVNIIEDQQAR